MGHRKPNLRSAIYRSKTDGRWHGWVTMGTKEDGSLDRRHRTGKTETEVTIKVRALESARDAGKASKPGRKPTVAQWMRTWLDTVALRTASPSTIDSNYRPNVERWIIPRLGRHRIDRLLPEHLDAFYLWLPGQGLSDKTILNIHRILSRALKIALRREIVTRNVAALIDAPSADETEIEPLSETEARAILDAAAKRRNGTRWSVALAMGLRQSESLGTRWTCFRCGQHGQLINCPAQCKAPVTLAVYQLKRRRYRHGCDDPHKCGRHRVACPKNCTRHRHRDDCPSGCGRKHHVCPAVKPCPPGCTGHACACPKRIGGWQFTTPKGKKKGTKQEVPVAPPLVPLLRRHHKHQAAERLAAGEAWQDWDLVWCQPNGRPIDPHDDWEEWKQLLEQAGVQKDARVHDTRHTAATLLLEHGVDIRVVQQILRHSQLSTTKRYTHVTDKLAHDAAKRIGKALWA